MDRIFIVCGLLSENFKVAVISRIKCNQLTVLILITLSLLHL